ncbi:B3 domain-containing protein REM17 isoform X2 [Arabidopsis lyrata subsp. lyrata]|uniref:B3 domain-containing protein REM17 isoform X2 n=1 Tax=Arabidopsis lyrata subsp. lyrata TaxID=81972 RepID=UPI000A29D7BF|nr:B3 domain-containing protein REM17 isoform X2 [Arabidopsis lyrata subsp. lyrata]|eukprot:XP_020870941.1 B3 domain-containing protein REM17 isoform X2 [Arabidopsis lyrata subsp. lyrata]
MADQSLLHSPIKPHFFKPLLQGFRTHLNIPVAFFSKHVEGKNDQNKIAKLRSDASEKTWLVKMDGLNLTDGWEDFAFAHDLRIGDIVIFRHEGEMVFHVTALGPSCCEIQYYTSSHNSNDDDRNDQTNIASRNSERVKKNPRKKVESSLDHSRFVAKVSAWGLRNDRLYIPLSFARSNGLNKINSKKIYLYNEAGRSWKLDLKHDKSGMHTYIQSGWRSFCAANGIRQGQYTFKLVRKSAPSLIRLCREKAKPKQRSVAESSSDQSCFEGSVSPSSLRNNQLFLPRSFVSSNSLEKRCSEIVLKNEQGIKWPSVLKHYKTVTYLTKGWTSFCQVNRIKAGDSYKFKLVGTWTKPVLSLCPTNSNHDKTPLECPNDVKTLSSNPRSGDDSSKSKEIEEENIEDKNISKTCLEIKKRKYWSRCRASVENMDDDQTNIGSSSRKKRVKKNPIKKADSSSDHSSFVANVTASSLNCDRLYLPLGFARSNGLDKMSGKKVVLLNEEGRTWKLNLKYNKAGNQTYVRPGWKRFCDANGMSQDQQFTFKLVQKHGPPVMRLYLAEHRPKSESSSHGSYLVGSVTASSINKDKLYLRKSFVSSNGLDKGCKKIVLKNEWGREWNLVFRHYKSHCFTIIKRGWASFCQGNGLKAGDSFKFKLVGTGEKPVLSLCPAESSCECPDGSDDVKSLSSNSSSGDDSSRSEEVEEESMEDKNISQDCLEIKKRKYCCSSSYSQNRFVTLTLTLSAFQTYKLYLPRGFTQVNGINKPRKITLLGQDGVKRVVDLYQDKISGTMRFGKGWRESCEAQGVKIDESFVLELIWEKEASPVLKFCTKLNSA